MTERRKTIKIVVAIPHKHLHEKHTALTTWSCGIFRRMKDTVEFKITSDTDFLANFSGNDFYNCIIFTLEDTVNVVNNLFTNSKFKPIVKNINTISFTKLYADQFFFDNSDALDKKHYLHCKVIYDFTKNISYILQNNMDKDITKF